MSVYSVDTTPMTDVQYYKLTLLFEAKLLTKLDIESLERWVIEHGHDPGFSDPQTVIDTLESFPDRPGHRYTP